MPKVTIEFNLPDEQSEFDIMNDASAMWCVIVGMQDFFRAKRKYSDNINEAELKVYEDASKQLESLIEGYQVRQHP